MQQATWKVVCLLLLVLLLGSLGYIYYSDYLLPTSTKIPVSGTWSLYITFVNSYNITGGTVTVMDDSFSFSGGLAGHAVGQEVDTLFPNGTTTFYGGSWFTGTVAGSSGTAFLSYRGAANATGYSLGTWAMYSGTGGLATLSFQGIWDGGCQNAACSLAGGTDTSQAQFG